MALDSISELFKLPGAEEIRRWQAEHRKIGEAIDQLTEKRTQLERIIAAARGQPMPEARVQKKANGSLRAGTWVHAVAQIVQDHPEGVSYADVRNLLRGELGEVARSQKNPKGFYGSMRRLEEAEIVVRHRSHLFTPAGYKRYRDKVERGEIEEVKGHEYASSPVADEVVSFLSLNGPSKASTIRKHLSTIPEFKQGMRNGSAIYNVLKRLIEREELAHDTDSATYRLLNENGAAEAAPEADEVAASSTDTQTVLRLIG